IEDAAPGVCSKYKGQTLGTIGDMGAHMIDMARWMLDLRYPKRVFSHGGIFLKKGGTPNIPDTQTCIFEYDDLTLVWNHRSWAECPDWRHPWGGVFYGDKGKLTASVYGYDFKRAQSNETESFNVEEDVKIEREKFPEDEKEEGIEMFCAGAIRSHMRDFIDRIEDRGRPRSDIEEGAISTICCILGNLSLQLGRALEWDEETGKIKNDEEANALLARQYRAPWVHPSV
ncbi:MAG: gfo/Idh/MocA family oxidoreductase, partial [Thermoguttaceae bacterium]|nr:gfo/Idh/MocA family oxidoreductase [Thermoguttaceae bacterium]